ncbi:hypothetical protein HanRHA438_Chr11g0496011 [Helianthus annuus]|nr:hypothetical protein HanRHA438_Chr11g0496011 [Helianthus annuus]
MGCEMVKVKGVGFVWICDKTILPLTNFLTAKSNSVVFRDERLKSVADCKP